MSKRSFKSKQKTETTNFDWKIWSLPPTPTEWIEQVKWVEYRGGDIHWYVARNYFFCRGCYNDFPSSEFSVEIPGQLVRLCFHCYHLEELDFGYEDPICLLPPPRPPTSSTKEEPGSESAST